MRNFTEGPRDDAYFARLAWPQKKAFVAVTVTIPEKNLAVRNSRFYSLAADITQLL